MSTYFRFYIRYFAFWILFFFFQRILFLAGNYQHWIELPFHHVLLSFVYALSMDTASASYLMLFMLVLLVPVISVFHRLQVAKFVLVYSRIMIVLLSVLGVADTGLFDAWGTRVNAKALSYLAFPEEAMKSFKTMPITVIVVLFAAQIFAGYFLLRLFKFKKKFHPEKWYHILIGYLILIPVLLTGVRGGLQTFPISKSWVYYSKYPVLNYASLNGFWNFMEIFVNAGRSDNPYHYFQDEKAEELVDNLFMSPNDSVLNIFSIDKPNFVFILCESFSAEATLISGGENSITPGFDSLCSEGLLFPSFYSTGFRTEQGIIAFLSCFPAQPQSTIMREYGKFDHLPSLVTILDSIGYYSSYYYSGDLDFANTRAYLTTAGIDRIYGSDDFQDVRSTDWGAYDEELFDFHLERSVHDPEPFFSMLMTSTSHEPFDADVNRVYHGEGELSGYKNTIRYLDSCIVDYLRKAQKAGWYDNTVFIITSDHAHHYPGKRSYNVPERFRIPFLVLGKPLMNEYKGSTIQVTGSQLDFSTTILLQLGISSDKFRWGKNLLSGSPVSFAFYSFDNGFGFIRDSAFLVYDHDQSKIILNEGFISEEEALKSEAAGKAFLQLMYEQYLGYTH